MKISFNWLQELVPALADYTPAKLAELLTAYSFETNIVKEFSLDEHITVVRIEAVEPHPNADRLRLATVTDGQNTIKVVCGAPNIAAGQLVPYSPPGTKVFDKDGQLFELSVVKIRGVESPGMLNSRRELGLGADHDGIFVLPEGTPLGSKLGEHITKDTILEAEVTPNRAHDCLSHLGIAREIAAILNVKVSEPELGKLPKVQPEVDGFTLAISDAKAVPRYSNIVIKDITNGSSPLWLQARLMMLDQKPISALVDITNYVMWEIGNPSHAFDASCLPGKTMGARFARESETIDLLDGSTQKLDEQTLIITSNDVPVALAGIMGGRNTQVTNETNQALIEIANFDAYTIQKAALALNLRTDAAARFLKGIDSNRVQVAAARLAFLVKEITGGSIEGVLDFYPNTFEPKQILLRPERVFKIAGIQAEQLPLKEIQAILKRLRCEVTEKDGELQVTPPSDRLDLTAEHDLVEEVIFQMGLQNIAATLDMNVLPVQVAHQVFVRQKIRAKLVELGVTETYSYSFEPEKEAQLLEVEGEHLELTNPVAPELAKLRISLLPGVLASMIKNASELQRKNIATQRSLFEIGHVYNVGDGGVVPGVIEQEHLAAIGVVDVTVNLRELLEYLHVQEVTFKNVEVSTCWQEGSQEIILAGKRIGVVGKLTQNIVSKAKYRTALYAFEINLDEIIKHTPAVSEAVKTLQDIIENNEAPVQYEELNRFPSVYRDVSVLVDVLYSVEQVKEVIERIGKELVVDTDLFDEYEPDDEGLQTEVKKKSLSFHIEYQSKEKTLTDQEVQNVQENIEAALKEELQAEIR